jgi:hypothetical protein
VEGPLLAIPSGEIGTTAAICPSGKVPIGGGFNVEWHFTKVIASHAGTTGWIVSGRAAGGAGHVRAYAVCAWAS